MKLRKDQEAFTDTQLLLGPWVFPQMEAASTRRGTTLLRFLHRWRRGVRPGRVRHTGSSTNGGGEYTTGEYAIPSRHRIEYISWVVVSAYICGETQTATAQLLKSGRYCS